MSRQLTMGRGLAAAVVVIAVVGLSACGDKPQEGAKAAKKADAKAWDSGSDTFKADGWKAGDKASWEQQLKARAEKQNEYARVR